MVFSRNSRVLKFSLWFIINRCEQLKIFFIETVIDILSFWHSIRPDSTFQSWDFYKKKTFSWPCKQDIILIVSFAHFQKNYSGKTWCYRHRNMQFYNYKTFCKVKIFQGFLDCYFVFIRQLFKRNCWKLSIEAEPICEEINLCCSIKLTLKEFRMTLSIFSVESPCLSVTVTNGLIDVEAE